MESSRDTRNATSVTATGALNLRQRLFGQPDVNSTLSENPEMVQSSRSRPSTISFFRKLQAGFRAENDFQVPPRDREYEQFLMFNQRMPLTGRPSYGSSSATDSPLIKELEGWSILTQCHFRFLFGHLDLTLTIARRLCTNRRESSRTSFHQARCCSKRARSCAVPSSC